MAIDATCHSMVNFATYNCGVGPWANLKTSNSIAVDIISLIVTLKSKNKNKMSNKYSRFVKIFWQTEFFLFLKNVWQRKLYLTSNLRVAALTELFARKKNYENCKKS